MSGNQIYGKISKVSPTVRQDAMYHVFGALNKKRDVVLSHHNYFIFLAVVLFITVDSPTESRLNATSLSYYRDTHKSDVIGQPELFNINNISYQDPGQYYIFLPSNNEVALSLLSVGELTFIYNN